MTKGQIFSHTPVLLKISKLFILDFTIQNINIVFQIIQSKIKKKNLDYLI